MKEIAVLGSTGSIGTQTMDVIRLHSDLFHASVIAAHRSVEKLLAQAEEFHPHAVVITDEAAGQEFLARYHGDAEVLIGEAALTDALVAGGSLVMEAAKKHHTLIRPVDSEHSAIFQSMLGQDKKGIHKILLTASGGPFRGKTREELSRVTVADAMKHPTWNMGMKVTLDSATLFNKGLEVIEAHWLFDVDYEDIEVVVQPQSLIHSMVEYDDGSIMAQIGLPDMRLPIQFALIYPERLPSPSHEFVDWSAISSILIAKPDTKVFRSLQMAFDAGKAGGDTTTAFNAANEEAIRAFIGGQISFLSIFDVVEETLASWDTKPVKTISDVWAADKKARERAALAISRHGL